MINHNFKRNVVLTASTAVLLSGAVFLPTIAHGAPGDENEWVIEYDTMTTRPGVLDKRWDGWVTPKSEVPMEYYVNARTGAFVAEPHPMGRTPVFTEWDSNFATNFRGAGDENFKGIKPNIEDRQSYSGNNIVHEIFEKGESGDECSNGYVFFIDAKTGELLRTKEIDNLNGMHRGDLVNYDGRHGSVDFSKGYYSFGFGYWRDWSKTPSFSTGGNEIRGDVARLAVPIPEKLMCQTEAGRVEKDSKYLPMSVNFYYKNKTEWTNFEDGTPIKTSEDSGKPHQPGDEIPGYELVRTDYSRGNFNNRYRPVPVTKWLEEETDKVLKKQSNGDHPDNDGVSDIPTHAFTRSITSDNVTTNYYRKKITEWKEEGTETELKAVSDGELPDNDGVSDIPTHFFTRFVTSDNVTTNYYKKKVTEWREQGTETELKDSADGELPDNDGVSDIDGYDFVEFRTVNEKTINYYVKTPAPNPPADEPEDPKPPVDEPEVPLNPTKTIWVDENGKVLKDSEGSHPDNDGVSDIEGYELVRTESDVASQTTKNIYRKAVYTRWIEEGTNKELKPKVPGTFRDEDGVSDIKGYKNVSIEVESNGSIVNVYARETNDPLTNWIEKGTGSSLKETEQGAKPDRDGNDVAGYKLVEIKESENGDVTNVYEKIPGKKTTIWVDETGKVLKDSVDGEKPDNDGKTDVPGYTLVRVETDKDGNVRNVYKLKDGKLASTGVAGGILGVSGILGLMGAGAVRLARRKSI